MSSTRSGRKYLHKFLFGSITRFSDKKPHLQKPTSFTSLGVSNKVNEVSYWGLPLLLRLFCFFVNEV